jgi:hypothetical protein
MKKILLSLLTTAAFAAPTFAASGLNAEAIFVGGQPAAATADVMKAQLATRDLSIQVSAAPYFAISVLETLIANGAVFDGDSNNDSLIHTSATRSALGFFKAFLKICIKRGFNIQANDQDGLNLLHRAAMNRDPKVAEFLISQGLETTSSAEYNVLPSLGRVYPLFFAIKDNRIDLAHLFLVGL